MVKEIDRERVKTNGDGSRLVDWIKASY